MGKMRKLTADEIKTLTKNNCFAENWKSIQVAEKFDPQRVHSVHFYGEIEIGENSGMVKVDGIDRPCGIYHATIKDCHIGHQVLISNISSSLQNYHIADGVVIENVDLMMTEEDSYFGNGTQINTLNEGGGREVTLFEGLNAQIAMLQAGYKHKSVFQEKLLRLIADAVEARKSTCGSVAKGAIIRHCRHLKNVKVGEYAILKGTAELSNGTILSCKEDPTYVGTNVVMRDFIVAEGAKIDEGAVLEHVFVGQGVRVGKTFSAEHSLFFANCEMFHSEACSVFAGPYTVSHHRSTLLIACLFSFYNAGSGTNQSNHMYKLGPVHQGVLERGCKTGSFSYLLLEAHVPAFSVVIGKHMSNINVPDLPFSYINDEAQKSMLIPGKNLFSIGTVRDGAKWPARDRRKAPLKRDLIVFDVYSPYTVEKMRRGRDLLQKLYDKASPEQETVQYGGVIIKRLLLRKGAKYYSMAIDRYLLGKVFEKIEGSQNADWERISANLQPKKVQQPQYWLDLAGLLVLGEKIEALVQAISEEQIKTIAELSARLENIYQEYRTDEWAYVCYAFEQEYGVAPHGLDKEKLNALIDRWQEAAKGLNALILADAQSEFADYARIGYGLYAPEEEKIKDFEAVRGSVATNKIILQLQQEAETIEVRATRLRELAKKI